MYKFNFLTNRFLKDLGDSGDDFMGRAFMPISVCDNVLCMCYFIGIMLDNVYIFTYICKCV